MARFTKYIQKGIVVDCCCGVGGNIIQFARRHNIEHCRAIDLDDRRNKYAKSNANKYGVKSKITFE